MLFSPTYRHSFGSAGTAETLARRDRPRILTVTSSLAKGNPDLVIRSATTVQLLAKSELILLSMVSEFYGPFLPAHFSRAHAKAMLPNLRCPSGGMDGCS